MRSFIFVLNKYAIFHANPVEILHTILFRCTSMCVFFNSYKFDQTFVLSFKNIPSLWIAQHSTSFYYCYYYFIYSRLEMDFNFCFPQSTHKQIVKSPLEFHLKSKLIWTCVKYVMCVIFEVWILNYSWKKKRLQKLIRNIFCFRNVSIVFCVWL